MIDNANIFTVDQLAEYLNMAPITIYRHAARGVIPGQKIGGSWRFHREAIDAWLMGRRRESPVAEPFASVTENGIRRRVQAPQ